MAKKKKLSSFERSFVAARRSGAKDFSFGGKKYNTKLKGPGKGKSTTKTKFAKTPAKGPTPTARPKQPEANVPSTPSRATPPAQPNKDRTPTQPRRVVTPPAAPAAAAPSRATPTTPAGKDTRPTQPRRIVTPPAAPKRDSNLEWKAGDVADTRKRMEEAKTPRPGKTGGIPTTKGPSVPTPTPRPASPSDREARRSKAYETNIVGAPAVGESTFAKSVHGMENLRSGKSKPEIGKVTAAKAPQGKVVDYTVNRGASGRVTATGKTARLPDTREVKTTVKTARLPPAVKTAPKTGRLKKTTVVARN